MPDTATAEAALIALSDPLRWETYPSIGAWLGWCKDGDYYDILDVTYGRPEQNFRVSLNESPPNRFYATLAKAKVACELHHATGKWQ